MIRPFDSRYDTKVESLSRAIDLAISLKEQSKYDWFRGQKEAWPLESSLTRCRTRGGASNFDKRIDHFIHWLEKQSALKGHIDNGDSFWAIAQHYGIPTNFIDFTTDPFVAGYFAKSNRKNSANSLGCIFCLNLIDLERTQRFVQKGVPNHPFLDVAPLSLEVDHLWRLQAQSGRFLYVPFAGLEAMYPFNRIFSPKVRMVLKYLRPPFIQ